MKRKTKSTSSKQKQKQTAKQIVRQNQNVSVKINVGARTKRRRTSTFQTPAKKNYPSALRNFAGVPVPPTILYINSNQPQSLQGRLQEQQREDLRIPARIPARIPVLAQEQMNEPENIRVAPRINMAQERIRRQNEMKRNFTGPKRRVLDEDIPLKTPHEDRKPSVIVEDDSSDESDYSDPEMMKERSPKIFIDLKEPEGL